MEIQQLIHVEALEEQNDIGQIGALDFGDGGVEKLVLELALRVEPEALPGPRSPSPPSNMMMGFWGFGTWESFWNCFRDFFELWGLLGLIFDCFYSFLSYWDRY